MRSLRVLVDGLLYNGEARGIGQYMRRLYEAYTVRFGADDTVRAYLTPGWTWSGVQAVTVRWPVSGSGARLIFEQLALPSLARRERFDAIHFPDYQIPVLRRLPRTVMTIHDLVAFRYPELFPAAMGRVKRELMRRSAARVDRIIVPSQATREDVLAILGGDPTKIRVIPHGVRQPGRADAVSGHPRPYFLAVGTIEPRKNFSRLIAAYALLRDRLGADLPDLLIAGGRGWLYQEILAEPWRRGVADHVHFLQYVSDDRLATLYRHCVAVVYPSLYEGFGLPVVEAMAAGAPVVCSARGALAEVSRGAAVWVDPEDPESIADGLGLILTGGAGREEQIAAGFLRAKEYTWDNAAQMTRSVFSELTEE